MKSTRRLAAVATLAGLAAVWSGASAAGDDLAGIKADLQALIQRVAALEAENETLRSQHAGQAEAGVATAIAATSGKRPESWTDKISFKGDLRYRYENIDDEGIGNVRERQRIRARTTMTARPGDNTAVVFRLASGGSADPGSTNQTLGNGGTSKDIYLDQAYFNWQASPVLRIIGGKMPNPWFIPGGNGMLWDSDYNPEGLAFKYDRGSAFFMGNVNLIESDTSKANARIGYGVQGGFDGAVGTSSKLVVGAGYMEFGVTGECAYYDGRFFGNTTVESASDCEGKGEELFYANDYEELELFAQLDTQWGGTPVTLFADYVRNDAAKDQNIGWTLGVKFGKASAKNTWELGYIYQDLEADAVFGLLADSNFGGGGTDSRGHIFRGGWAPGDKWKVGFSYFVNEQAPDSVDRENYNRLQVDTVFKF